MTDIKSAKIGKYILLDVIPFSLGIETVFGVMTVLIPRNSTIPTKKTCLFSNYEDNQTFVCIEIYEGERQLTKDNYKLGKFYLDNIPSFPRGGTQIEITFEIDANSRLFINAIEKSTGIKKEFILDKKINKLDKIDRKGSGLLIYIRLSLFSPKKSVLKFIWWV